MAKISQKLVHEQKLWVFTEVVRCGSITEAANTLCMTQPAVSTIIRQLEHHFDVKLFEVVRKKICLTPAARMLNEQWSNLRIAIDNLHLHMQQFSSGIRGKIRVAMVSSAKYFVPQIMCSYMRHYPHIKFDCDIRRREDILPALENGFCDIGILTNPLSLATFSKFYLGNNKLIFIGAPNHPLVRKRNVQLHQLQNENFIIREQTALISQMLFNTFQTHQLELKILLEIDSTEAIKQAVISGLAIALIPEISVGVELKHNIIGKIAVKDVDLQSQWHLICKKSIETNHLVANFINFTKTQFRSCS